MVIKGRIKITVVIALISILVVAAYLLITAPRRNLERFLRLISEVNIGKTKMEDWRIALNRTRVRNLTIQCDQGTCGVGLRAENGLLQRLRLAPRTIADYGVSFQDGIASEVYVALATAKLNMSGEWQDDQGVVVQQSTDGQPPCDPHYNFQLRSREKSGKPYWATIAMGSCVSPQDRAKALAINSSCLSQIGGCRTLESMIPQMFGKP